MTVYNATSTSCANARAAWAAHVASGSAFRLFCGGDSITAGYNDSGIGGVADFRHAGWAMRLLALLDGTVGDWDYAYDYTTQMDGSYTDPLRAFSGDWAVANDGSNVAQYGYISGSATSGEFAFGPVTCDSFTLHVRNNTAGSFQYNVDGGAWSATQSVATAGPWVIPAGTVGSHTLHIRSTDAAHQVNIMAIEWNDSSRTYARFSHTGRFGAPSSMWANSTDSLYVGFAWTTLPPAPDLLVLFIGTNDQGSGTPEATTAANLSTVVDAARLAGKDVLLVLPPPIGPTNSLPTSAYHTAVYGVANTKDVPLLDLQARWVDYSTAVANGYLSSSDANHPTSNGHADLAHAFYDALVTVLNVSGGGGGGGGPAWTDTIVEQWNGSAWATPAVELWNGTTWVDAVVEEAI